MTPCTGCARPSFRVLLLLLIGGLSAAGGAAEPARAELTSTAFEQAEPMPSAYTCDGEDVSPPLAWGAVPAGAKSLALICDDPDAPAGTWVHWVIYGLPPDLKGLSERVPPVEELANGARQGRNDFGKIGYNGPCPPGGTHRYFFKLYALDLSPDLQAGLTKSELLKAMEGHVLVQGSLMGTYERK
ncbi:MAG: YbhB/YbcL family Raf kinase inhibitor-like protein [bacterium]